MFCEKRNFKFSGLLSGYILPVTALAASFCLVPPKAELKKCAAYFFKRQKAAAFRLRSPPAVEAKILSYFNVI